MYSTDVELRLRPDSDAMDTDESSTPSMTIRPRASRSNESTMWWATSLQTFATEFSVTAPIRNRTLPVVMIATSYPVVFPSPFHSTCSIAGGFPFRRNQNSTVKSPVPGFSAVEWGTCPVLRRRTREPHREGVGVHREAVGEVLRITEPRTVMGRGHSVREAAASVLIEGPVSDRVPGPDDVPVPQQIGQPPLDPTVPERMDQPRLGRIDERRRGRTVRVPDGSIGVSDSRVGITRGHGLEVHAPLPVRRRDRLNRVELTGPNQLGCAVVDTSHATESRNTSESRALTATPMLILDMFAPMSRAVRVSSASKEFRSASGAVEYVLTLISPVEKPAPCFA